MNIFSLLFVLSILFSTFLFVSCVGKELPVQVQTTEGTTVGFSSNATRYWFNVPFAQPPIGNLRFAPPKSPKPYSGMYDATKKQVIQCKQFDPDSQQSNESTEDCLYLDIYAPLESSPDFPNGFPVLFWMYGYGFISGNKMVGFDGTVYAQNNTVVVSINYRLGIFGFLRVDDKTPGNNGFLDQILALEWVNQNIASFGGDPKRITISGQNSGATSVILHLTSPLSKGLFQGAIAQSPVTQSHFPTTNDSHETASVIFGYLNCTFGDKNCVQAVSADLVASITSDYTYACVAALLPYFAFNVDLGFFMCGLAPEVGNDALPEQPTTSFQKGKINVVPVLMGVTWNEGLAASRNIYNPLRHFGPTYFGNGIIEETHPMYIKYLNQLVDHQSYEENNKAEKKLLSERAQKIYDMYPLKVNKNFKTMYPDFYNGYNESDPIDANYVNNALYHDRVFLCPVRTIARQLVSSMEKKGGQLYLYQWKYVPSIFEYIYSAGYNSNPIAALEDDFWSENLYASNLAEVYYVWMMKDYFFDEEEDIILSRRVISAWNNFVHSGNPNKGPNEGQVQVDEEGKSWSAYDPKEDKLLMIEKAKKDFKMEKNARQKQCDFWDEMGFEF